MPRQLKADSREHVIERFSDACADDERVIAAFIGGSLATGKVDRHSDLDLFAILEADSYDAFFAERREFVRRWVNPVFLEDFNGFGFDMLVFILDSGLEGELSLANEERFLHLQGGPYRVLVDKQGILEGVEFPWGRPSEEEQNQTLRRHLYWFWRDLSLFMVALDRAQRWTAYGYLESMRRRCLNLARLSENFTSWADGYEKVEQVVRGDLLAELEGSFDGIGSNQMIGSVKQIITFYQALAPELARRHGVPYPKEVEAIVLGREAHMLDESGETEEPSG
jgi:predicted nucleotidyltransferase